MSRWKERGVLRINLDFLPVIGQRTIHHEPPKFEMEPKVQMVVDHAGHATIHRLRYLMFGRGEDWEAYMGQASLMDEMEADWEDRLRDSPELLELIRREILKWR